MQKLFLTTNFKEMLAWFSLPVLLTGLQLLPVALAEVEDVVLVPPVVGVDGLHFDAELLDDGAGEARLGVGVRIPGLLLHRQRRLGNQRLQPPWGGGWGQGWGEQGPPNQTLRLLRK